MQGDLTDRAFVTDAVSGADARFFVCPPALQASDHRDYTCDVCGHGAAAVEAGGVAHTVLLSSIGAELSEGTGSILGLHDAEGIFAQATPALNILRPAFFMENYLGQIDAIRETGSVFMPLSGDARIPMVASADTACVAAESLRGPVPGRPTVTDLRGPRYSLNECAAMVGSALGRPVSHVRIDSSKAREHFIRMGVSKSVADPMLEMY